MIEYRGEIIELFGRGYLYDSIAWPQLDLLKRYIDSKLDKSDKIKGLLA
jgi:hypothetical protein